MRKLYTIHQGGNHLLSRLFSILIFLLPTAMLNGQTTVIFNTPGTSTWTVPTGVTSITVSVWGGGGAGGGTNSYPSAGGGGAGGSFVRGTVNVIPGSTFTITVGRGGQSANNANGGSGESSVVMLNTTTIFRAVGGNGGSRGNSFGNGGESAITGNTVNGTSTSNYYGGSGGNGTNSSTASSGGGGGSAGAGGNGGNGGSPLNAGTAGPGSGTPSDAGASGAAGRGSRDDGDGHQGSFPGGGGSGARDANAAGYNNGRGGNGGNGQIIISYIPCNQPSITTQPSSQFTCPGNNVTFNVTVSGTGTLSYQWRKNGNVIPGATNASYSINGVSASDAGDYSVYITNACGNATSGNATLTIGTPTFNTHPANRSICANSNTTFQSGASGTGVTYQWQVSTNGGSTWNNISNGGVYSGVTNQTLSLTNVPISMNSYQYRAIATVSGCSSINSNAATLSVSQLPQITGINGVTSICEGTNTTLTATSNATTPIYSWHNSLTGGMQLSTGASYTTPNLNNNTTYYAAVKDNATGCVSSSRTAQMVTVNAIPEKPTINPASATMCQQTVQSLFSGVVGGSFDVTETNYSSGSIPNNNTTGISRTITIPNGTIPNNAQNIRVEVKFNITEGRNADLTINLKAPNGNVLNLLNRTGKGSNFTNTVVSSSGTATFSSSTGPYTGTFKADVALGANAGTSGGGSTSNTQQWTDLYSDLNGNWQLNVSDNNRNGNDGSLSNWSLTIFIMWWESKRQ